MWSTCAQPKRMAVPPSRNIFGAQVLIVLCLSSLAAGLNNTATPLPDDQPVGWQAGDDDRSTWDIISNCLLTILACTWSVQHLNVPGPIDTDGKWARFFRNVKWMVINILFPEFIVLHAALELVMAVKGLEEMADKKKEVTYPWWHPRSRLLSPFVRQLSSWRQRPLGMPPRRDHGDLERPRLEGREVRKWTLTHSFFANMGGICYRYRDSRFPLTACQIAMQENGFDRPAMTKEAIQDKSKSDWFAKGVAVLQFSQLALSLMVRTSRGLAFSQLEAVTVAFAVCGALTYLVYLHKPQHVQTPFVVWMGGTKAPRLRHEETYDSFWGILLNKPKSATGTDGDGTERIPNDNVPTSSSSMVHPAMPLLALASGLFGAMHAIAWNFEFPTAIEKILWRTATAVAAGSPVIGLIVVPFAQSTIPSGDPQRFMEDCLRLLREFSWHASDNDISAAKVDQAYIRLEKIYIDNWKGDIGVPRQEELYLDIFSDPGAQSPQLGRAMLKFLKGDGKPTKGVLPDMHDDFHEDFELLCGLMMGRGSEKLRNQARTNVFPRKNLLPKGVNLGILSLTSGLYCLARLSLLAIALSSLRLMPKSVYSNTPWTAYIPVVGAMR